MTCPNWVADYVATFDKIPVSKEVESFYSRNLEEMGCDDLAYFFDPEVGQQVIDFIEKFCRHYQGEHAGKLVQLELFQKAFIQCLFGWLEKDTYRRRYREYFFEVARKHGKSFLSACIAVYMLCMDGEPGSEVYTAATKLDQARIIYKAACNIIKQSPELRSVIKAGRYETTFSMQNSVMKPLPSESKSLDGLNIHFAALDEIHEQRDRNMYDVLKQGMSARKQPLIGCITTSGFRREGLYDSLHDYAVGVALGDIKDDRFLPLIYKLDSVDEWTRPECWMKANPGLGTIKSREQLADGVERAKNDPSYLATLLTKDFDMKQTETSVWLPLESVINEAVVSFESLAHSYAVGGCDLSATTDLTCATLLIRKPNDENVYVLQKYFIPQAKVDKLRETKSKEAPYELWEKQGWVQICQGAAVDYHEVTQWFVSMAMDYDIRPLWVCYDRALSGYWVPEMKGYGFDMDNIPQGPYTWSQPMKEMGAAFEEHKVVYQNNPVLRWCLCNTAQKAQNRDGIATIQPVKIQENRRIDGTVSLLNAWVGYTKHYDEYMPYVR